MLGLQLTHAELSDVNSSPGLNMSLRSSHPSRVSTSNNVRQAHQILSKRKSRRKGYLAHRGMCEGLETKAGVKVWSGRHVPWLDHTYHTLDTRMEISVELEGMSSWVMSMLMKNSPVQLSRVLVGSLQNPCGLSSPTNNCRKIRNYITVRYYQTGPCN